MYKYFVLVVLIFAALDTHGEVYKWTDEQGKVHFGDKPPAQDKVEAINQQQLNARSNSYVKTNSNVLTDDIYRNRRSDTLVMYTTSTCGYCAKARKHFAENDIRYIEKNIDTSARYQHEFKQIKGKGVPLIFMGQYQMSGFSVANFTRNYEKFKAGS